MKTSIVKKSNWYAHFNCSQKEAMFDILFLYKKMTEIAAQLYCIPSPSDSIPLKDLVKIDKTNDYSFRFVFPVEYFGFEFNFTTLEPGNFLHNKHTVEMHVSAMQATLLEEVNMLDVEKRSLLSKLQSNLTERELEVLRALGVTDV